MNLPLVTQLCYLVAAGLLNLLAIVDAFEIATGKKD